MGLRSFLHRLTAPKPAHRSVDAPVKLVCVVNQSLKMGKGKIAAQVGHASVQAFLNSGVTHPSEVEAWLASGQKKICLKTPQAEDFEALQKEAAAAIEEAFSGLDTNTSDLVPLPSPELFSKFKDTEVAKVDAAKLKAAVDVLKETTKSVKRTDTGVCLPSPEALTKIALIQTEASAAVDPAAAAKFAAEAKKLGGAVNPRNVLPLVPYVEPGGLLPRSFPADQLARFKKAGFALEAAQKQALKAQKGGGLSGMAVRGAPAS